MVAWFNAEGRRPRGPAVHQRLPEPGRRATPRQLLQHHPLAPRPRARRGDRLPGPLRHRHARNGRDAGELQPPGTPTPTRCSRSPSSTRRAADEQLQADFLRDFMTLSFSHPAAGRVRDVGLLAEPPLAACRGGCGGATGRSSPTDSSSSTSSSGTGGPTRTAPRRPTAATTRLRRTYDVTVTVGNTTRTVRATLSPDGTSLTVDLPVPAVVGRHVFYNNSAFDGHRAERTHRTTPRLQRTSRP